MQTNIWMNEWWPKIVYPGYWWSPVVDDGADDLERAGYPGFIANVGKMMMR